MIRKQESIRARARAIIPSVGGLLWGTVGRQEGDVSIVIRWFILAGFVLEA